MMHVVSTHLESGSTTLEIADGPPADFGTLLVRIRMPHSADPGQSVAQAQSTALEAAQDLISRCLRHNQRMLRPSA